MSYPATAIFLHDIQLTCDNKSLRGVTIQEEVQALNIYLCGVLFTYTTLLHTSMYTVSLIPPIHTEYNPPEYTMPPFPNKFKAVSKTAEPGPPTLPD